MSQCTKQLEPACAGPRRSIRAGCGAVSIERHLIACDELFGYAQNSYTSSRSPSLPITPNQTIPNTHGDPARHSVRESRQQPGPGRPGEHTGTILFAYVQKDSSSSAALLDFCT